jgi:hypothetical protein
MLERCSFALESMHILGDRYSNCTFPMNDRNKGVYMPSRIRQGSVWTHGAYPLQGFTR